MTFARSHFSMLIKYVGISFITGAISHGFFSGNRSLITGVIGVICFILGTLMEEDTTTGWKSVISGAILAVGIGAVTGGLQHFPDSPERSLWILPVGFAISLIFYAIIHDYKMGKREYTYASISLIATLLVSVSVYYAIENMEITAHGHDIVVTPRIIETSTGIISLPVQVGIESVPDHHN
ncbi:hypothetical protein H7169_01385 [Candidatus Gracilibacteria bacterium]|nr:hypothetical protein [Candidatus Gracilibacteria bacterium]